jgi:hypothetical protein
MLKYRCVPRYFGRGWAAFLSRSRHSRLGASRTGDGWQNAAALMIDWRFDDFIQAVCMHGVTRHHRGIVVGAAGAMAARHT